MPSVETWVVLLRGINVGGKAVIPMADLREAFAEWATPSRRRTSKAAT